MGARHSPARPISGASPRLARGVAGVKSEKVNNINATGTWGERPVADGRNAPRVFALLIPAPKPTKAASIVAPAKAPDPDISGSLLPSSNTLGSEI
jgi:hypothetical protein